MKKKGFTLIELLAVIVILAIIALIATPLVLKYIEKSRKESKVYSAYSFVRNLETEIANYALTNNGSQYNKIGQQDINNLRELNIKVKGDNPNNGKVCISEVGQVTSGLFQYDNYFISYDGNKAIISENTDLNNFDCNVSNNDTINKLDHTVTFMVEDKPYEIVSVTSGNTVTAPSGIPMSDNGSFVWWQDVNGEKITFPYLPTADVNIYALFSKVRTELEISSANIELLAFKTGGVITKVNDGKMLAMLYKASSNVGIYTVSEISQDSCTITNQFTSGTVEYNGRTFYYSRSRVGNVSRLNENVYDMRNTEFSTDLEAVTHLLDYYHRVI